MIFSEFIKNISNDLKFMGRNNYANEAMWIACFTADIDRNKLIFHMGDQVSNDKISQYDKINARLLVDEPLQYILEGQDFYGLHLHVDQRVLIPRPETEELVDLAIKIAKSIDNPSILDLCTGSGAIILAIANNVSGSFYGSDISSDALAVAKKNAGQCNLADKIDLFCGDLFSPFVNKKFDIIISNPPYIGSEEIKKLDNNLSYEPNIALDGGVDGLSIYRRIFLDAPNYLNHDGYLLMEIGFDQGRDIEALAEVNCFADIHIIRDSRDNERIFFGRFSK